MIVLNNMKCDLPSAASPNTPEWLSCLGIFYDKRLFIFLFECTWIAQPLLHVYFWHGNCGNVQSSSRKSTSKKKKKNWNEDSIHTFCELCDQRNLSSFFLPFCLSFLLRFFVISQSSSLLMVATTYLFPYQSKYVQKFLVLCLTVNWTHQDSLHRCETDTPSHKNVTFFKKIICWMGYGLNYTQPIYSYE